MVSFGPSIGSMAGLAYASQFGCCQFMSNGMKIKQITDLTKTNPEFHYYSHAPFDVNLTFPSVVDRLQAEINVTYGTPGTCVVHIGRCRGWTCQQCESLTGPAGEKLEQIAERINSLDLSGTTSRKALLLENAAGQRSELGASTDSLRKIWEALDTTHAIGLCWDTQHSFSAGVCDYSTPEVVEELIEELSSFCTLSMIHLNDSKVDFNGHVDRHEALGKGYIWRPGTASLQRLVEICGDVGIDLISETHDYTSDRQVVTSLYPDL